MTANLPGFDRPETIRGLSLTQPWAWLVTSGPKDIENRRWNTRYRGLVAIHAAKRMPDEDVQAAFMMLADVTGNDEQWALSEAEKTLPLIMRSAIVGVARIVDVLPPTQSPMRPWRMAGQHGFVLEDRRAIEPIPCAGALGLWRLPPNVEAQLREALQ